MGLSFKRPDPWREDRDLPALWRIGGNVLPNDPFIRSLLRGAIENSAAASTSGLPSHAAWLFPTREKSFDPTRETYESAYISPAEAGLRETMEDCQTELKNREMIQLANINYGKIIKELAHLKDKNLKVLRMPELLGAMIKREDNAERKWHLEFLRDSLLLWMSQRRSDSKNQNVLYYPYHRILEYDTGRKSHETHINNFLNANARKVIEDRLTKRGLFTDKKEYFDYASAHPSDWHSAAHQNTPVKHLPTEFSTPQCQALGNYSLSGLVKGFTEPDGKGDHYVCIANAYSLVNDSFDFDGFQWLGNWNFASQDICYSGGTALFNGTFRKFSEASGGYGRDYRIVSNLYEIPPDEINFP